MAYSTANPPQLVGQAISGNRLWIYASADVVADVDASGYFTNGGQLGMAVGDRVIVSDTATPLVTDAWVSAVSTTSPYAATVTADI